MSGGNHRRLLDIRLKPGNDNRCADCNAEEPEWASHSIGVFLCATCCGIHRSLGTHISKTKGIKLDNWDDEQVAAMDELGNASAAKKYLVSVPPCYRRPDKNTPAVLKEQWIKAKYERLEFQNPERQLYLMDEKSGYLMKRGRDDGKFLSRRFELRGRENLLMYYTKEGAKSPKAKLPVDKLNCCFVPSKIGNLNGMQISYPDQRGHTRNIYVFSSDGKDIVDWYMAIRNVKLTRLRIGLPHVEESELVQRLTSDFILEGWLYKTGPDLKDAWKRRWFTFDRRKLLYFDEPLGAYAKGEIFLGEAGNDCSVYHGLPNGRTPCGVPFTLRVPAREYPLAAECEEEREQWMVAIKTVLATPLSLQEQAGSCVDLQEIRSSSNLSTERVTALLKTNSDQVDFNTLAAGTDSVIFSVS